MNMKLGTLFAAATVAAACNAPTEPVTRAPLSAIELAAGLDATVRWNGLEGGFWAIQASDGRWLDPHESLPPAFRVDGLAVHVTAQPLKNVACFHMVGTIGEIVTIRAR